MNSELILRKIETVLPDSQTFQNEILENIKQNYFPLLSHSLYSQLKYTDPNNRKFTLEQFKKLLNKNQFLLLVNDIYRTRVSLEGLQIINDRLNAINNFDDYKLSISIFEKCNPRKQKNGEDFRANAFSLGTKVLHFYNPEINPILDSVIRKNLKIKDISFNTCIDFTCAARKFVNGHPGYFELSSSKDIIAEFAERGLTTSFPKMAILDMALYSY